MERFLTLVANHPMFGMLGAIALIYIGVCCGRWFAPKMLEIFCTACVMIVVNVLVGVQYGMLMGSFALTLVVLGFLGAIVGRLIYGWLTADGAHWPLDLSRIRPHFNP